MFAVTFSLSGTHFRAIFERITNELLTMNAFSSKKTFKESQEPTDMEKPHYEAYLKKTYTIKDIVKNYEKYRKSREQAEMYQKRRDARKRSLWDLMDKDLRRTYGKARVEPVMMSSTKNDRKVETMVRRSTYDVSQKNLAMLSKLLDRLNEQY